MYLSPIYFFSDDKYYESNDLRGNYFIEEKKIEEKNSFDLEDIHNNQFQEIFQEKANDESEIEPETHFKTKTSIRKTKIFENKKFPKKVRRGPRKKGDNNRKEIKHDKTASDNIKVKIIRRFIQSNMNYLNNLYKKYPSNNKRKAKIFLRKIKTDFTKNLKKDKILEYFSKTLRQFYSSNLGDKFKKINKNYNKDNIDKLYQENKANDIIELLNKTLEEVYEKYINKEIPEFNLYNDLNEIKEKENEGNDYIDRYEKIALKLITTYKNGEIIKNN